MTEFLEKLEKMYHESNYLFEFMTDDVENLNKKLDECLLIAQRIAYKNNTLNIDNITPKRLLKITK